MMKTRHGPAPNATNAPTPKSMRVNRRTLALRYLDCTVVTPNSKAAPTQ